MANKYKYNLDIFKNEDAKSYYLLGAFITDGCIINNDRTIRASLSSNDNDWLELINQYVAPEKPIIKVKDSNCYLLIYNCQELVYWFIDHGCYQRKSLTIKMPNVPKKYMKDFIRGCFDGDGSLSFTNRYRKDKGYYERCRRAKITSASKDFIYSIYEYLCEIGIKSTIQITKPHVSTYKGRIIISRNICYDINLSNGEEVYKFCKLFYNRNSCLVMPRKQAIASSIIEDWERKIICESCGVLLNTSKNGRKIQFCCNCYDTRKKESDRKANKKFRENLRNKRNEINNS